jgi:hypothetical protein
MEVVMVRVILLWRARAAESHRPETVHARRAD